jgi:hypothetical protein
LGKGTRLIDLETFLPQFYKRTSCRSCVEARNKEDLQDFAAFYDGHLEELGLWKRAEHKRPNPVDVWRSFVAERSAAGSALYTFVPPQKLVKETPVGLASKFMFECSGIRRRGSVGTSATGTHSNKHGFKVFTSKRVHKDFLSPTAGFAVNQRIALAATASGKQAGDIHTFFATIDLLLTASFAFKWRPFRRAELAVGHAIRDGCSGVVHGGPRAGDPIDRGGHPNEELQYQDTAPRRRLNSLYWPVPPIEALFWSLA